MKLPTHVEDWIVNYMNESKDKTMKKVLPKVVEEWIGAEDICFITGKVMGKNDLARFTYEFDAWISEEGQEEIEKLATFSPEGATRLGEAEIIYREWYAQDAAADANDNNDHFRKNHKLHQKNREKFTTSMDHIKYTLFILEMMLYSLEIITVHILTIVKTYYNSSMVKLVNTLQNYPSGIF